MFDRTALDGHGDIAFRFATNPDDARPINNSVTTCAAYWCAGDFAAFGAGLLFGDILGVQVNETANDLGQPLVGVMPAEIAVASVEVDTDRRTLYEPVNTVQSRRVLTVLLVRFKPDENATGFGYFRCFHQRVAHEGKVLLFGG